MKQRIFYALIGVFLMNGFHGAAAAPLSAPEACFETVWHTLDERYGNFEPKGVDWDLVYRIYRPQVTADTTDDDLFSLLCHMLDHLNDGHVQISTGEQVFQSGTYGAPERNDFSCELVMHQYLRDAFEQREDGVFIFGKLTDRIGYVHFTEFSRPHSGDVMDELLDLCGDCDGIVIDVRNNGGGQDYLGRKIAGRFADKKRPYLKTRIKKERDKFTKPVKWYIEPQGGQQFTGPVVVITNHRSVSAAEVFTLGMRTLPHVTHIGDTTSGVFADTRTDTLPNGWRINYPHTQFTDHNGFCWEGIGVVPQLRVVNSPQDMAEERDRPIEFAIHLIQTKTQ